MKKIGVILATVVMLMVTGCEDENTVVPNNDLAFSAVKGEAQGTADFATETPNINIKNISTYVGEDIDYSTGVEVTNTDDYDDFQMWVDASQVDVHTEGLYEVVYRFVYGGKTLERKVIVNVIARTDVVDEPSGDETQNIANNATTGNNENHDKPIEVTNNNASVPDNSTVATTTGPLVIPSENNQNNNQQTETTKKNENSSGSVQTTTKPVATTKPAITTKPTTTKPVSTTTASNNNSTTTHKQIVTSGGEVDTKTYTIGYMNIELLSGSVVKIKCTSSKYIVSTRTDISTITKQSVEYKVYKLIITYNTGAEQVLETYEEKVK